LIVASRGFAACHSVIRQDKEQLLRKANISGALVGAASPQVTDFLGMAGAR
jgi:triosephosphate isomerase